MAPLSWKQSCGKIPTEITFFFWKPKRYIERRNGEGRMSRTYIIPATKLWQRKKMKNHLRGRVKPLNAREFVSVQITHWKNTFVFSLPELWAARRLNQSSPCYSSTTCPHIPTRKRVSIQLTANFKQTFVKSIKERQIRCIYNKLGSRDASLLHMSLRLLSNNWRASS